ncbi:hypothetical protein BGZ70_007317 [Mortierella alpina]|uniref:GDP-fucose protein O-fucosyltransferase 2 n=1 Tax=Mortierella alpina TaxID=64518 RepID=A0A9P6J6E6_MORAP|nr:hypothetical protein BGZ70_007317 [Mortierella alpina]
MVVLHIANPPFARSDSLSCQAPASSGSSTAACAPPLRSQPRPDEDEDGQEDVSGEYRSPFRNHDRPRAALPHPAENSMVDGQAPEAPYTSAPSTLPIPQQPQVDPTQDSEQTVQPIEEPPLKSLHHISDGSKEFDNGVESPVPTDKIIGDMNDHSEEYENSEESEEGEEAGTDGQTPMAVPFESTFDAEDETQYLTYLPYAGITNQFYGMLRGMEVAKALGRTLIIPPITASSHDKSKQNQPWSKFLDLSKFAELTGTKVVEFHELRDSELAEVNELKCGITCGFGSKRTIDFTAKGFLKQWKFNVSLEPLRIDANKLDTITSLLRPRSQDKYLCISNTYKISVKDKSEWERFGQYLHFTEELESFVQEFLDQNLVKPTSVIDSKTNTEITPTHQYLAIHARRGDFAAYCESNFKGPRMVHCLPSTEQFAERIDVVQSRLNPTMDPEQVLPVFVATNERRPEELKKFADLGWRYLDHDEMGTADKLGVFGPMMVDQVFMAHAQALVGIQMSTFSRVGALRQRDWHGRKMEYM